MVNENIAESRNISTRAAGQQVPPALGRSAKKNYGEHAASFFDIQTHCNKFMTAKLLTGKMYPSKIAF
jgi:hypothetical protein